MIPLVTTTGLLWGIVFLAVSVSSGLGLSLALGLTRARPPLDWIEFGFINFMLDAGLALCFGLILAWLGWFSLGLLTLILGVIALASWIIARRRGQIRLGLRSVTRPRRAEGALIGLLALLSVIYFRPHEFVLGGADAGVYVNMGAHIAQSGQLLIDDPLIAQLDPSFYPAFFREQPPGDLTRYYYLPGYYVSDTVRGQLIPQFYALQAISIAILTAIGGVSWGLWATPVWGLAGIAAVYFLARGLFERRTALLAAVLLGVVILQNWFSRYPTAEVLTQAYLFAGLYALGHVLWRHEPQRGWGFLAGLWLGIIFLTRIDMILVAAVLVVLLIGLLAARRWSKGLTVFILIFGAMSVLTIIHALFFAWPYTYNTYRDVASVFLGKNGVLWLGAGLMGCAILFGGARWFTRLENAERQRWLRWLSVVLIVALSAAAVYAYFIRPGVENATTSDYWYNASEITSTNRENLVRIGWYVTPLGLIIALAGLCLMLGRERSLAVWLFAAIGLVSTTVYVVNILNNPHHIYAMRRYVPVVIPAMMIWGAYGLAALSRVRWRGAQVMTGLVLLAWLGGMIWQSRVIWRQVDYSGMVAALTQWNRQLAPGSILLFDDQEPVGMGDFIGTPMRFIFDHPVFAVRNPQAVTPAALRALVQNWQQQGRSVYVVSETGKAVSFKDALPLGAGQQFKLDTTVLLPTYTEYPNQVIGAHYDLTAREVQALPEG